jgi:hydrogenase nickel incorporation protein HypB
VPVIQINTAGGCHLDANMVQSVLPELPLEAIDLLVIENVGNLVCPAEFDLGEDAKVMLLSITEGDDKPLKYPRMFRECEALLVNKVDLAPHLDVSLEKIRTDALALNPSLQVFEVSARSGAGLEGWYGWLEGKLAR